MIKLSVTTLLLFISLFLSVAIAAGQPVDYKYQIEQQLYDMQQYSKAADNNIFYKREPFLNYIWNQTREDLPEELLQVWYSRSNSDLANVLYLFYKHLFPQNRSL